MKQELVGQVLKKVSTKAHANRIEELEQLLGTDSAKDTARIALFFGMTIGRDLELPDKIGLKMDKSLLAGHDLHWTRPFEPDEPVEVTVSLKDVTEKGDKTFATVETLFETPAGEEIQRQHSTFIMFA